MRNSEAENKMCPIISKKWELDSCKTFDCMWWVEDEDETLYDKRDGTPYSIKNGHCIIIDFVDNKK